MLTKAKSKTKITNGKLTLFCLLVFYFGFFQPLAKAQNTPPGRIESPLPPNPLPTNTPTPLPSYPANPPTNTIPTPSPQNSSPEIPEEICVEKFNFKGNSVFNNEELEQKIWKLLQENYSPKTTYFGRGYCVGFEKLNQVTLHITKLYSERGYETSLVYIPVEGNEEVKIKGATVLIEIIEDRVETINVTGSEKLNEYVRSRLAVALAGGLNQKRLVEALELLRLDPLIKNVSAELSPGNGIGARFLEVKVTEAPYSKVKFSADNAISPSIGSFRRGVTIFQNNLLAGGDGLNASYRNTDGSNQVDVGYTIPVNPNDGTLGLRYFISRSNVVESPFTTLDIFANARIYELTFNQPVLHSFERNQSGQGVERELTLGVTATRIESDTSILGINFPLSEGANQQGQTRISALRFFQQWKERSSGEVFFARSVFNWGLGLFDSTTNSAPPDSRFFSWKGDVQWLRLVAPNTLFSVRSSLQFADRPLLGLEQFGLGGQGSVRGYRQDVRLADNGLLASAEIQLPVLGESTQQGLLSVIPFFDVGTVWNNGNRTIRNPTTLASLGLGLQWQQSDRFRVRVDYGLPLVNLDSRRNTWQDNGVYFTVEYSFF